MVQTTTNKALVKPFQAVEEAAASEGTTPASPNFSTIGALPVEKLSFDKDKQYEFAEQIGPEDYLAAVPGYEKIGGSLDYYLDNSTFTKRLTNAANFATPTGTVSNPMTAFYSFYLDAVEYYRIFKGMKIVSGSLKGEIGKALRGNIAFLAMTNAVPTTAHGFTTPTLVSSFNTSAILHWKSDATPLTVNSVAQDATSISVSFNRGTKEDPTYGTATAHSSQPYGREITFSYETLYATTAKETLYNAETAHTVAWDISGTSTLTLSNCVITKYKTTDVVANGQETIKEIIEGRAKSATLS